MDTPARRVKKRTASVKDQRQKQRMGASLSKSEARGGYADVVWQDSKAHGRSMHERLTKKRPAWNGYMTDQTTYKLSDKELLLRKLQMKTRLATTIGKQKKVPQTQTLPKSFSHKSQLQNLSDENEEMYDYYNRLNLSDPEGKSIAGEQGKEHEECGASADDQVTRLPTINFEDEIERFKLKQSGIDLTSDATKEKATPVESTAGTKNTLLLTQLEGALSFMQTQMDTLQPPAHNVPENVSIHVDEPFATKLDRMCTIFVGILSSYQKMEKDLQDDRKAMASLVGSTQDLKQKLEISNLKQDMLEDESYSSKKRIFALEEENELLKNDVKSITARFEDMKKSHQKLLDRVLTLGDERIKVVRKNTKSNSTRRIPEHCAENDKYKYKYNDNDDVNDDVNVNDDDDDDEKDMNLRSLVKLPSPEPQPRLVLTKPLDRSLKVGNQPFHSVSRTSKDTRSLTSTAMKSSSGLKGSSLGDDAPVLPLNTFQKENVHHLDNVGFSAPYKNSFSIHDPQWYRG